MSIPGCDYSYDPPTPAELRAAGMRFACRYVGTPQSGKNLTLPEAQALKNAGISIVANYEAGQAGWMQGGRSVGVTAAEAAHADAVRLGMPPTRPIIFSADFNATYDQYKTQVKPCLQGAGDVLGGPHRVGVYGSVYVVTWAMQDGVADWGWQTYAWSQGQWYLKAQLQQWKNGQKLGSGTVDYDRATVADYGQWDATGGADMPLDQTDKDFITATVTKAAADVMTQVVRNYRFLRDGQDVASSEHPSVKDVLDAVAALQAGVDALQAGVPVTLTDAQLASIKASLQTLEGSALVQLAVSPAP